MYNILVYCTWAVIAVMLLFTLVVYKVHDKDTAKAWEARCSWLTCFTCGMKHSSSTAASAPASISDMSPMQRVAQLLAVTLDPLQFTLSDVSVAMKLVGVWHRSSHRSKQLWHSKMLPKVNINGASSSTDSATALVLELPAVIKTISDASQESAMTGTEQAPATPRRGSPRVEQSAQQPQQSQYQTTTVTSSEICIDIVQTSQDSGSSSQASASLPELGHSISSSMSKEDVHPEVLQEAAHFMHFALGIYGWMMHIWANRYKGLRCCTLCFGRGCGCCCNHDDYNEVAVEKIASDTFSAALMQRLRKSISLADRLTREAIQQIAGIEDRQLLHINFKNELGGILPYFVALDPSTCSVVVAVRGTLTLADCITDLLCEPAEVSIPEAAEAPASSDGMSRAPPEQQQQQQQQQWYAHRGMWCSSTAILKDLRKHGVMHEAMEGKWERLQARLGPKRGQALAALLAELGERGQQPWRLVFTGHSLGAGVAGLLALQMHTEFRGR